MRLLTRTFVPVPVTSRGSCHHLCPRNLICEVFEDRAPVVVIGLMRVLTAQRQCECRTAKLNIPEPPAQVVSQRPAMV